LCPQRERATERECERENDEETRDTACAPREKNLVDDTRREREKEREGGIGR